MYAIARSGGKQFKIQKDAVIRVPNLKARVGEKVRLDEILLLCEGEKLQVGHPLVQGAYAEARVLGHGREKKIKIIKYKRRKNYRRTSGHRQGFTELFIDDIVAGEEKNGAGTGKGEAVKDEAAVQATVEEKAAVVEDKPGKEVEAQKQKAEEVVPEAKEEKAAVAKDKPGKKVEAQEQKAEEVVPEAEEKEKTVAEAAEEAPEKEEKAQAKEGIEPEKESETESPAPEDSGADKKDE